MKPKYEIRVFWSDEDEAFIAIVPELPYLSAWGASHQEALDQALVAVRGYLKVAEKYGDPVPEPGTREEQTTFIAAIEPRGRDVADVLEPSVPPDQTAMINDAAEQFAEAVKESYQTVADRAISADSLNAELIENFFNSVINNLRSQAESNRQMTEELQGQQEHQREATQALTQESVGAYKDFVNSIFSHYQDTKEQAGRRARQTRSNS